MAEMRLLKTAEDILRDEFERHRAGKVQALVQKLANAEMAPQGAARRLLEDVWKEISL